MLGIEPMTALLSSQSFKKELEAQQKLVSRANGLSALALIGIDSFKHITENHGHLVGGAVITRLTEFLQSCLRSSDVCSRYSDEKFAIIMPATSVHQAAEKIDSIREEFGKLVQTSAVDNFNVTLSAGISAIRAEPTDISSVIEAADEALTEAKSAGHNRIKVAP
ncbi:MAG: diguanylate cyclase [Pseudomonadales bacterium]|jgi:diguanylate cyclase